MRCGLKRLFKTGNRPRNTAGADQGVQTAIEPPPYSETDPNFSPSHNDTLPETVPQPQPTSLSDKLILAAKNNEVSTIKELIEQGADVNAKWSLSQPPELVSHTAIQAAIEHQCREATIALLDASAVIDADNNGAIMYHAAKWSSRDLLWRIFNSFPNQHTEREQENQLLQQGMIGAIEVGSFPCFEVMWNRSGGGLNHPRVIDLVVERSKRINATGPPATAEPDPFALKVAGWACGGDHKETMQRMLDAGVSPWAVCEGRSLLVIAATYGLQSMIEQLLKAGAGGSAETEVQIVHALQTAIAYYKPKIFEALLPSAGHVINKPGEENRTLLQTAVHWGQPVFVRMLLETKGVDVNAQPTAGTPPPLVYAAQYDLVNIAELILQHDGVDVNAVDKKTRRTALHWAAARGHMKVLQLLLSRGADASVLDLKGKTPMMIAKGLSYVEICRVLDKYVLEATGAMPVQEVKPAASEKGKEAIKSKHAIPSDYVEAEVLRWD